MKRRWLLAVASLGVLGSPRAHASAADLLALYERFLAAQNARDLGAVRALLWDSPSFLWVSDGTSFWGPDALVERMAEFQKVPVWRVEPDLGAAVPVEIDERTGYLHLPLVLVIGDAERPARLPWLVSMLGIATPRGWRIAALFTTVDKHPRSSPDASAGAG